MEKGYKKDNFCDFVVVLKLKWKGIVFIVLENVLLIFLIYLEYSFVLIFYFLIFYFVVKFEF